MNPTINNVKGNITNAGNPEGASNFTNGKDGKFFEIIVGNDALKSMKDNEVSSLSIKFNKVENEGINGNKDVKILDNFRYSRYKFTDEISWKKNFEMTLEKELAYS